MVAKILGIVGSPRKKGASATMIDTALASAKETGAEIERLDLVDYNVKNCTGCDACLKPPNECPLSKDDDYLKIEQKVIGANAIILAAPSYFSGVPVLTQNFIDRSRPMKMAKYKLQDKIFAAMGASGLRQGGGERIVDQLNAFALTQGMVVVGGLGHPVIEMNSPIATLQGEDLKAFRKPGEDQLANAIAKGLGKRVGNLIAKLIK
ncbi:MAG: NADPH-dependent FMN reductase [Promethearchaeota archaeon CR_4]|nr:MAG: NADPH-dependent FMN reductase [Candidatus Lokiarchaeota archaeon CR_4]